MSPVVAIDPAVGPAFAPGDDLPQIPHLDYPFQFVKASGQIQAAVNEQDSDEDIRACVHAILDCPIGGRLDDARFGVPSMLFAQAPLDTAAVERALSLWEPRATADVIAFLDGAVPGTSHLQVDVASQQSGS